MLRCLNALGNYMPPLFIFKENKLLPANRLESGPSGAMVTISESG